MCFITQGWAVLHVLSCLPMFHMIHLLEHMNVLCYGVNTCTQPIEMCSCSDHTVAAVALILNCELLLRWT
jgi:hypothetical protein